MFSSEVRPESESCHRGSWATGWIRPASRCTAAGATRASGARPPARRGGGSWELSGGCWIRLAEVVPRGNSPGSVPWSCGKRGRLGSSRRISTHLDAELKLPDAPKRLEAFLRASVLVSDLLIYLPGWAPPGGWGWAGRPSRKEWRIEVRLARSRTMSGSYDPLRQLIKSEKN